ncbi:MAG: hypothetical protein LQ340_006162 [Diploschistes diacapsis]|nr:MAG: hypothetical protein LQ340_006162 [Diploschistes diacapsis]
MRFFTGWGDARRGADTAPKTPALGLSWSNQIACRVALVKQAAWARDFGPETPTGRQGGDERGSQREGTQAIRGGEGERETDAGKKEGKGRSGGEVMGAREPAGPVPGLGAEWAPRRWRRWARVVFAAWTAGIGEGERGVEFEVWAGGVRSLGRELGKG